MRLSYEIAVVGRHNVDRALSGIERRMAQHNRRVSRETGVRAAGAKSASSSAGSRRIQAEIVKEQRFMHRERMRAIKLEERARVQAERTAGRAAADEERRRDRFRRNRARNRLRGMRENIRARSRRVDEVRQTLGSRLDNVGQSVRTVGRGAATAVGAGAAFLTASAIREASSVDRMARRLIINSRDPGDQGLMAPEELTGRIQQTALKTGVGQEPIAEGLGAFVEKTGDLKTAVDNMQVFATIAQATGADFRDVASAAADLSTKMDIKSVEDMKQAFATLAFQGKKGSFELRNMAAEFPEILANARAVGIRGTEGVKNLGGFLQIARTSTGSAEETTTAVQQVFNQLAAKAGDIQSGKLLGKKVNVYEGGDETGEMRDFRDVIADVIAASGGDMGKIIKTFDVRGKKAVTPFVAAYKQASIAAGGGSKGEEAGRAAIMKMFTEAAASQGKFTDVERDAADALKGTSAELERAFLDAKITLSKELMPAFTDVTKGLIELAPMLKTAAEWTAKLAKSLKEDPVQTIGALIALKATASIVSAGIGNAVKNAIVRQVSGRWAKLFPGKDAGGGGGTGVGIGGGKGGKGPGFFAAPGKGQGKVGAGAMLGAAGTGAMIGLTVASAIITAGVANFEAGEANIANVGEMLNAAREAAKRGDVETAKDMFSRGQAKLAEVNRPGMVESLFGKTVASAIDPNKEVEVASITSFVDEMRKLTNAAEEQAAKNAQAAAAQEAAAGKLDAAGDKLARISGGNLNRSNAPGQPSPI